MKNKKMKEQQIINEMVVQIEEELGMKCKVVPQSDKWYDGYCLDTHGIAVPMSLGIFQDHLKFVKEKINSGNVFKGIDQPDPPINTTITLINNGINRNLMRMV